MSNINNSNNDKRRIVRPWDLLNPAVDRVPEDVRSERLSICYSCPLMQRITKVCAACGCIMPQKTKLSEAFCPKGKWDVYIKV